MNSNKKAHNFNDLFKRKERVPVEFDTVVNEID